MQAHVDKKDILNELFTVYPSAAIFTVVPGYLPAPTIEEHDVHVHVLPELADQTSDMQPDTESPAEQLQQLHPHHEQPASTEHDHETIPDLELPLPLTHLYDPDVAEKRDEKEI